MKKLTQEQFIKKSNSIHNNFYDYTKSIYKNNNTNILIICKTHGDFYQKPGRHMLGQGCRKCHYQNISDNKYCKTKEILFSENDISYYLLGVFITDGNVIVRKYNSNVTACKITSKDLEYLYMWQ